MYDSMAVMRCAAIQLEAVPADVDANLAATERLVEQAAAAGAKTIALPEFFTTGIGFLPELAEAALPPDGKATELLLGLARRHGAMIGGSSRLGVTYPTRSPKHRPQKRSVQRKKSIE